MTNFFWFSCFFPFRKFKFNNEKGEGVKGEYIVSKTGTNAKLSKDHRLGLNLKKITKSKISGPYFCNLNVIITVYYKGSLNIVVFLFIFFSFF